MRAALNYANRELDKEFTHEYRIRIGAWVVNETIHLVALIIQIIEWFGRCHVLPRKNWDSTSGRFSGTSRLPSLDFWGLIKIQKVPRNCLHLASSVFLELIDLPSIQEVFPLVFSSPVGSDWFQINIYTNWLISLKDNFGIAILLYYTW